jgi:hypothetical protein
LRDKLHKEHKCKIYYEFMIQSERKRQVALRELYGSWNDNFHTMKRSRRVRSACLCLCRAPGMYPVALYGVSGARIHVLPACCALPRCCRATKLCRHSMPSCACATVPSTWRRSICAAAGCLQLGGFRTPTRGCCLGSSGAAQVADNKWFF